MFVVFRITKIISKCNILTTLLFKRPQFDSSLVYICKLSKVSRSENHNIEYLNNGKHNLWTGVSIKKSSITARC